MFSRVIVPLDGSALAEAALPPGVDLARACGASLVLVSAVGSGERLAQRRSYLSKRAGDLDVACEDPVADPDLGPAELITKVARSRTGSVVCMATHGRSGVGRARLGSVAEHTLGLLGEPVLLVGQSCRAFASVVHGPVVVCLDGSAFSEAGLGVGADWAGAFGMDLWAVTARAGKGDGTEDAYMQAVAERFAAGRDADGRTLQWEVLSGDRPSEAIVQWVEPRLPALLVMTTHGRTGLARFTVGSVTMRVVADAPCPVLVSSPG